MFSYIVPLTRIHSDYVSVFMSNEFTKYALSHQCRLTLALPKHLEMNSVLDQTWQSLCHLKNSFIVHVQVDESCTHFALLYAIRLFQYVPSIEMTPSSHLMNYLVHRSLNYEISEFSSVHVS